MAFGGFAPLPIRLGGSAEEGWSPAQHARLSADQAAIKRVMPLAVWQFTQSATPPYPATITAYTGQNGRGLAYAPTITVNGAADVSFQFDDPYFEDPYGVQHPFKIRHAVAAFHRTGASSAVTMVTLIDRGVQTWTLSMGGTQVMDSGTVKVW